MAVLAAAHLLFQRGWLAHRGLRRGTGAVLRWDRGCVAGCGGAARGARSSESRRSAVLYGRCGVLSAGVYTVASLLSEALGVRGFGHGDPLSGAIARRGAIKCGGAPGWLSLHGGRSVQ